MDKEAMAIWRLKYAARATMDATEKPLVICYSGGKDSTVLLHLAIKSGAPIEVINHHTTVDAPETVYFIRSQFSKLEEQGVSCRVTYPTYRGEPTSMWRLIRQKMQPPTRLVRYCCQILKEDAKATKGRNIATGVRWDESARRKKTRGIAEIRDKDPKKRQLFMLDNELEREHFEGCRLRAGKVIYNPIVDWTDAEIWDYIADNRLEVNPLYCEGWKRVGCIGCPLATRHQREREFTRWPKYEKLWRLAFANMIRAREEAGRIASENWSTVDDLWNWWMGYKVIPGQISLLEED